jgi:ribose 5-phosphate isomerase A
VGLGTGSTSAWMVRCLAERVKEEGLRVTGVPTSRRTAELATQLGLRVVSLDEAKWLDLTIDGADEFDADLNLIKGGGAALLQEKIVATASDMMVVIADPAKEVATLGAFPLPVEVIPFGWWRWTCWGATSHCACRVTARWSPTNRTTSWTCT